VKGQGRDGFENWLTDLLDTALGKPAVAKVAVSFASVDGADICRIDVHPSPAPVYARRGPESDLFVRLNNSTRLLNTQEAVTYIGQRWAARA
jgi:ATP-dependent Lon protease